LESVKSITDQQEHHKLRFGANLFFAHEGLIEHVPLGVLLKEVDAFRDLGINRVDINMGLFPWRDKDEKYIAKYDAVVKRIRDAGLDLAINPQYSPVRHRVSSLAEWTREAIPVYEEIARRYKPEILVTIHEPTTMNKRMKAAASPAEWRDFVRAAALAVRKASPGTRCGAGALHVEKEYFREFLSVDELDVVTIDIYGLAGLRRYNEMIRMAGRAGKPVYIEETWRPPYYTRRGKKRDSLETISATGIGLRSYQDLDIDWLEAITQYASAWGLESITPFWTQTFFKYVPEGGDALSQDYNEQVMDAISKGKRTDTYYAYQRLIKRFGTK